MMETEQPKEQKKCGGNCKNCKCKHKRKATDQLPTEPMQEALEKVLDELLEN